MAKQQLEYHLQKQVCQYIAIQYPQLLFLSDTIASCNLTMQQAVRNKAIQKEGFKTPDLVIFQPNANYNGLLIELKVESPYKKDGSLYTSEHLKSQNATIENLNKCGYYACFSWGFDMTKKIIDDYLSNKL